MVKKNTPGCGCCLGTCGECSDTMPDEITIDLGTTNWTSNNDKFYYTTCTDPCVNLQGEFVCVYTAGTNSQCRWEYSEVFCYTHYTDAFQERHSTYHFHISVYINDVGGTWKWIVLIFISETNPPPEGAIWGGGYVTYTKATTTSCLGTTTLDYVNQSSGQFTGSGSGQYKPCNDTPEGSPDYTTAWTWPATITVTA